MYILPYIRKQQDAPSSLPLTQLWLFLANGGRQVWQTDSGDSDPKVIVREYLEANGLYGTPYVKGDCLYYAIDSNRTNIQSFYNWLDDGVEELEVWRPFFWLGTSGPSAAHWGWSELVEGISFGLFGSLERVWKDLQV